MFGKAKIQNFNVRKSKNLEFNKLQNLQNYISLPSVRGVWIFSGITYNPVNIKFEQLSSKWKIIFYNRL